MLPLTITNGSISDGATTITISKGNVESQPLTVTRTSGTTAAVTVDIGTLPGLPADHSGYTLVKSADLPLEIFSLLAGGICDRTPQVQTAILGVLQQQNPSPSTCAEVTQTHLATGITSLFLNGQGITALQAGDFASLTSLTELRLYDNQLATLPADLFDDLTALTTLYLNGNQLSSLPEGIFDGLSSLTTLYVYGNSVDPLPLIVSLEKVGADQVKAVAPSGAPFEIVLPLTVANGSIDGGATTITIPAGSMESEPLTVVRTPGTTAAVTMDIGTLPRPPTNHSGYALVKSTDLPLEIFSLWAGETTYNVGDVIPLPTGFQTARLTIGSGRTISADNGTYTCVAAVDCIIANGTISQGTIEVTTSEARADTPPVSAETAVCDRTPQVRDAIVAAVSSVSDCGDVTETHLAAIAFLYLSYEEITALKIGDFDGTHRADNARTALQPVKLPAGGHL